MKEYNINRKYEAYINEPIVEFKYAKVKTLNSKIPHLIELLEQRQILFLGYKDNALSLHYKKLYVQGKYSGFELKTKVEVLTLPVVIQYKGFQIQVFRLFENRIVYSIIKEPKEMNEHGILGDDWINEEEFEASNSKKNKGLKF